MNFKEPLNGWFTHLAWNIDLHLAGSFVRGSGQRRDALRQVARLASSLRAEAGIEMAHVLEVKVIPPLKGGPRYDVALLVRAEQPLLPGLLASVREQGLPEPVYAMTSRNAGLFGNTEERNGEILLNHFAGVDTSSADAVDAWKSLSAWYSDRLKVDNSTLLQLTYDAPFLIVNYARIPGRVVPFVAGQLLRPSFHRTVRTQLRQAGLTPYPLFARRVEP